MVKNGLSQNKNFALKSFKYMAIIMGTVKYQNICIYGWIDS